MPRSTTTFRRHAISRTATPNAMSVGRLSTMLCLPTPAAVNANSSPEATANPSGTLQQKLQDKPGNNPQHGRQLGQNPGGSADAQGSQDMAHCQNQQAKPTNFGTSPDSTPAKPPLSGIEQPCQISTAPSGRRFVTRSRLNSPDQCPSAQALLPQSLWPAAHRNRRPTDRYWPCLWFPEPISDQPNFSTFDICHHRRLFFRPTGPERSQPSANFAR